ncbi:SapB/AmfS family lanthipeptide [Streptomyces sp. NPDC012623]
MQQILDLQELETEHTVDENGAVIASDFSTFACDSNVSVVVC